MTIDVAEDVDDSKALFSPDMLFLPEPRQVGAQHPLPEGPPGHGRVLLLGGKGKVRNLYLIIILAVCQ